MSQSARENPEEYRRKELEHVPAKWPGPTPQPPPPAATEGDSELAEKLAELLSPYALDQEDGTQAGDRQAISDIIKPHIAAHTREAVSQAVASLEMQMKSHDQMLEQVETELAETRAKRDEYDDGQAHWFNEHFKLRVERDALTAENEKLREALTMLHRWCTEDQLDLSREGITRATVLATVTAALHPATKEGKA